MTKPENLTPDQAALTPSRVEDAHHDPLRTMAEAAEQIRHPLATLRWWRAKGLGPQFGTIGRKVLIRQSVLTAWVEDQMNAATKNAGVAA